MKKKIFNRMQIKKFFQLDKPISSFVIDDEDSYMLASTINLNDGELKIERFYFNK